MPVGKLFKRAEYFVPRTTTKADALKGERVEIGAMTAPSVRCRLSMITLRTSSVLNVESLDDFPARSIETNWFALIEA